MAETRRGLTGERDHSDLIRRLRSTEQHDGWRRIGGVLYEAAEALENLKPREGLEEIRVTCPDGREIVWDYSQAKWIDARWPPPRGRRTAASENAQRIASRR